MLSKGAISNRNSSIHKERMKKKCKFQETNFTWVFIKVKQIVTIYFDELYFFQNSHYYSMMKIEIRDAKKNENEKKA